ncbi:MAG: sphingomyelin phosphodiesterase [Bacteroidia bacterium]|nr:sphingomyelin phosphodiesterase [Bacteroidia bacterium]
MKKRLLAIVVILFAGWGLYQNPAISGNENPGSPEELRILTWNIFMRPRLLFKDGQLERAKAIVEQLRDKTYDVIVFQEAIDKKARAIIWEGLKELFPYQVDPGKGAFLKTNGGVWILSKHEIKKQKRIIFKGCVGTDCFCKKGALLVEVNKNNKRFQVIGTHLQSEVRNKQYKINRVDQYNEINEYLLKPNFEEGVPQLVVGDLNTPDNVSEEYRTMLTSLESQDAEKNSGEWEDGASWGAWTNDMFDDCQDRKAEVLDYILFKSNGHKHSRFQKSIRKFRQLWNGRNKDLSDHYAVEAVLNW